MLIYFILYLETRLAVFTVAGSRYLNIISSRSGFFIMSLIVWLVVGR